MSHLLRADLPDIVNDGQKGQFTKCLTIYFVMTLLINIYCTGKKKSCFSPSLS